MVKDIVKDTEFLSKPLKVARKEDEYIITDLIDTANNHIDNCAGLAANQIGYDKSIIVIKINDVFIPFVNPVITKRSKTVYMIDEGCLSLEGVRNVRRHKSITILAKDKHFKSLKRSYTGFTAEVLQHEIDHCRGKLI